MNVARKEHDEFCELCERYSIEWCEKYGELGYDDPARGILFADWNDIPKARLITALCERFTTTNKTPDRI